MIAWIGFRLLVGGLLFAAGIDALTLTSLRLTLVGLPVALLGLFVYVNALRSARRRNTSDAQVVGAITLSGLLILSPILLRVLSQEGPNPHRQDPDPVIGWVPAAPPGTVGTRRQKVDPGRPAILIVGDSVAHGSGVAANQTFAAFMEPLVPPFQVLNASSPGYSIDQYYLYMKRLLPQIKPRLVVIAIYAGNDFEVTSQDVAWGAPKPLFVMSGDQLVFSNEGKLEGGCIFRLANSMLFGWKMHGRKTAALALTQFFCQPTRLPLAQAEAAIAGLFRAIDAEASRHGAKVAYLLSPSRRQMARESRATERYKSRYAHLRRLLEKGGHTTYEPYPDLARSGHEESALFVDAAHYSPLGHQIVAERMNAFLLAKGLLGP